MFTNNLFYYSKKTFLCVLVVKILENSEFIKLKDYNAPHLYQKTNGKINNIYV